MYQGLEFPAYEYEDIVLERVRKLETYSATIIGYMCVKSYTALF